MQRALEAARRTAREAAPLDLLDGAMAAADVSTHTMAVAVLPADVEMEQRHEDDQLVDSTAGQERLRGVGTLDVVSQPEPQGRDWSIRSLCRDRR